MSQLQRLTLLVAIGIFVSFFAAEAGNENRIIPKPSSISFTGGDFTITKETRICIGPVDPTLADAAKWFSEKIFACNGFRLHISSQVVHPVEKNYILFRYASQMDSLGDEGYRLEIEKEKIIITAHQSAGIFYALQTIRQLLPADFEKQNAHCELILPCVTVTDKPAFRWRGLMLDCCRHFMEKDFVKRYIDLLAYYKMNRLHWHLTDDQGWRMEIKKYPLLTQVGGWREEADSTRYGGFYTQEDIREIISYAADRHVMVVPEIEMPGHCMAALASYSYLSCTGEKKQVPATWGVFKDVYCAGNDSVFTFLENVLTEVCDLFPSPYIHVGGDEVPKYRWENCPKCKMRMDVEHLGNAEELQSYFFKRIEKFLETKNKKIIGWEEIAHGGLPVTATIQSWKGMEAAVEAAKNRHDAIVSPTSHAYFDYSLTAINLEKVFSFNPIPDGINGEMKKYILGGECNMWSEYAPQEVVDSKIFPRMLAMSEVVWSGAGNDFNDFQRRVQLQYLPLKNLGVKYGYEKLPVEITSAFNNKSKIFDITLSKGQDNLKIYYSTNGSDPDARSSKIYSRPFKINSTCELKAIALPNLSGSPEIFSRRFAIHKAIGKKITIAATYSPNYPAAGPSAVIDGLKGSSKDFRDGIWQGYQGKDIEAVVDLGRKMQINKISAGFLQSNPSWIFMPEYVDYAVSDDGINFTEVSRISNNIPMKDETLLSRDFQVTCGNCKARYVKVFAKNAGKCPPWHNGAGEDSWLFIDEIAIE